MVQVDKMRGSNLSNYYLSAKGRKSYVNYSFALALFTYRLYTKLRNEEIKKVFFLAREGEFLKRLFDEVSDASCVESEYLYVSRQSTFAASLNENIEDEDFSRMFNTYKSMSVCAFLENLTILDRDIEILRNYIPVDFDLVLSDFEHSCEFRSLVSNEEFKAVYKKTVLNCKRLLAEYLEDKGFFNYEKLAIVDVGWRGSIQDNIYLAGSKNSTIIGYYLGLSGDVWTEKNNQKEGLLFSDYPTTSKYYDIWKFDSHFFERILTASHPSIRSYKREDGKVIPESNSFGREEENYKLVKSLQDQVYKTVVELIRLFNDNDFSDIELERQLLYYHILTVTNVDADNMRFQARLLKNQEENFGGRLSNEKLLKSKFSVNNHINLIRRIKKTAKDPMLLASVFRNFGFYSSSAFIVKLQKRKLLRILRK